MKRFISFMLIGLVIITSLVIAEEFPISTATLDQKYPAVSSNSTDYFVIWEDYRGGTTDKNIYGQRIDEDGGTTTPILAISTAANNQSSPVIASNGRNYLAAWYDESSSHILGRWISSTDFEPAPTEISSTPSTKGQLNIAFGTENYLLVWKEMSGGVDHIKAQLIDDSASTVGGEITVSSGDSSNTSPVVEFGGSKFIVVWEDESKGFLEYNFVTTSGGVFSDTSFKLESPSGTPNSVDVVWDGVQYMLVWDENHSDTRKDIMGQKVSNVGEALGRVTTISEADGGQSKPSICWDGGSFLTGWTDSRAGIYTDIYGTRLSEAGEPVGSTLVITDASNGQVDVDIAWNDSNYLAVWGDYRGGYDYDVYGELFEPGPSSSGGPLGSIISPIGEVVSQDSFLIKLQITDPDGVNPSSIDLSVNDSSFGVSSERVEYRSDTLLFSVSPPLTHDGDTLSFKLLEVRDSLGNSFDGTLSVSLISDLTPPQIEYVFPESDEIVSRDTTQFRILVKDRITSANLDSTYFECNGESYTPSDPSLYSRGDTLVFSLRVAEVNLSYSDTLSLCVYSPDQPDWGDSNVLDSCWSSYVEDEFVSEAERKQCKIKLGENYPDPFSKVTIIPLEFPSGAYLKNKNISLELTDINGDKIVELNSKFLNEIDGNESRVKIEWNGENQNGEEVESGLYFLHARGGNFSKSIPIIFVK